MRRPRRPGRGDNRGLRRRGTRSLVAERKRRNKFPLSFQEQKNNSKNFSFSSFCWLGWAVVGFSLYLLREGVYIDLIWLVEKISNKKNKGNWEGFFSPAGKKNIGRHGRLVWCGLVWGLVSYMARGYCASRQCGLNLCLVCQIVWR